MGMAFLSHSSPVISFLCWQTRDEHGHYGETWRICLEGFWETSRAPAFAVQVGACRKNKGMACFPSGTSTAADFWSLYFPFTDLYWPRRKVVGDKLTGLLKTVHQVGTKIIYENYFFFSPWRDWFLLSASFYHRLYQRMAVNTEAGPFCVPRGFKQSYVNWSMVFLKP